MPFQSRRIFDDPEVDPSNDEPRKSRAAPHIKGIKTRSLNEGIALASGWLYMNDGPTSMHVGGWVSPEGFKGEEGRQLYTVFVPAYDKDLESIQFACNHMIKRHGKRWRHHFSLALYRVLGGSTTVEAEAIHATAAQRAEAFCKVEGLTVGMDIPVIPWRKFDIDTINPL